MKIAILQKIIDLIRNKKDKYKNLKLSKREYTLILDFYKNFQSFRTDYDCAKETHIDIKKCRLIKKHLYYKRELGMYYFKDNENPQPYMLEYIQKRFPDFSEDSFILEIGPGKCPIINDKRYKNWHAIDRNFENNEIDFNGRHWNISDYPTTNIYNGSWEDCSNLEMLKNKNVQFDFIISSHSFEHVFEPIKSLKNAASLLKKDGCIILFVPDGFSDEPAARGEMTHTLFLVPKMIEEFFHYSDSYKNLKIESFRPNYDYVITAQKR